MATLTLYMPKNVRVAVKAGDEILVGQSLIDASKRNNAIYNVAQLLKIAPKKVRSVIRKKGGEGVEKGDVLASKRSVINTKSIRAPFAGRVVGLDEERGEIEIAPTDFEKITVISPVHGTVRNIDEEKVDIDFNGVVVFAKQGMGSMRKGLLTIVSKADEDVLLTDIKEEHQNKVLQGGHFSRQIIQKAFGIGAASVLATSIDEGDFFHFEEAKLLNTSLLLISTVDYNELTGYQGREAVVEGMHKRIIIQL